MRHSVTRLNSQWWLAACDWLASRIMPYNTVVTDVAKILGVGFQYAAYRTENNFELIIMIKMETRHPVEGWLGREIWIIVIVMAAWSRKNLEICEQFLRFLNKPDEILFFSCQVSNARFHRFPVDQISWNLADKKSVKSCVADVTEKKQNFVWLFSCRSCADRAQNLSGPAPDNVLRVLQSSSKSVHCRQSYRSESNIRLKPIFEPNKNKTSSSR